MDIPFTQFMMPDGRRKDVLIDRPNHIVDMARKIIEAGYRFEIEMLSNGLISMEVINRHENVLSSELCKNGPDVPVCVDRMTTVAYSNLLKPLSV